jgi:polyhydroxyalkanoate synthesis regulator phasin
MITWAAVPAAALVLGGTGVALASANGITLGTLVASRTSAASPAKPTGPTSPGSKTPGQAQQYCDDFVNHFAASLGSNANGVRSAFSTAGGQTIDDAVKNGDLTSEQAAKLKTALANHPLCSGLPFGALGKRHGEHAGGFALRGHLYLEAAADALGMSAADLRDQLQNGSTLQQLATSKGMNEAQFRTALTKPVTDELDELVKQGKITSDQKKMVLDKLATAPLPMWNRSLQPKHRVPAAQPAT